MLNQWDNYAQSLGDASESGGLRQAYGMLEGIAGEVRGLKEDAATLESHPGLKSLVDELDVLATVEQFKFNRGDYQ